MSYAQGVGAAGAEPAPKTTRILNVLRAHGGDPIIRPPNDFIFGRYDYLFTPRFWDPPDAVSKPGRLTPPLEAIGDYDRQCSDLGVELIMVFLPRSAALYPGLATNIQYDPETDGRIDIYFQQFLAQLDKIGVRYVDPTPRLLAERYYKDNSGREVPIYETHGSHWHAPAARIVAEEIAGSIRETEAWRRHMKAGRKPGAIHVNENALYDANAPGALIQLLGDSFLDYPLGTSGSLRVQLVTELNMPMNAIFMEAGAASTSRQALARVGLAPETKIIVWEVASNALMIHSRWKNVPIKLRISEGGQ